MDKPQDSVEESSYTFTDFFYATFPRRLLAYFLDTSLLFVGAFLICAFTYKYSGLDLTVNNNASHFFWLVYAFYSLASIGYFTLLTAGTGMTAGKYIVSVKVTRPDGSCISYGRSFVRCLGYYVSGLFLYIGFLLMLVDSDRQTFHDKIVDTVVVEI